MKIFTSVIIIILIVSCNVLPKNKLLKINSSPIELGVVGMQKKGIKKTAYQIYAIPVYKNKIKVAGAIKTFDNANYQNYLKSIRINPKKDIVKYIDSVIDKPLFIELEIIDKLGVVKSLNTNNPTVFNYLKKHDEASLVSKVRIAVEPSVLLKIKEADAFYLQTSDNKQQYLQMFNDGDFIEKINLYGAQTFGYELSSFCWEVTDKREIKLSTIVHYGQNCTNGTKRKAPDLIEELTKSSFKF